VRRYFPKLCLISLKHFLKFAFFIEIKTKSYKIQAMLQIAFIRENQEKVIKLWQRGIWMQKCCGRCRELDEQRRATQVELDGILAESNKLSKDIGEMMKNGEKSKAAILKENGIKQGEKQEISRNSGRLLATELTEKLYTLQQLPADIVQ
jgi:seryl-tRNA synthetase